MKTYTEGTHRTVSPEVTLSKITPLLGKFGITRLADVTGLDHIGIPVFQAVRPNSRSISVSQGKGLTKEAAACSALMESIELWHCERLVNDIRFGSWNDLDYYHNITIEGLSKVSTNEWHPDRQMHWVYDDYEGMFIPLECVSTDYTVPNHRGSGCFAMTSNGLASGNTSDEALVHALCEVIERDAVTLFYNSKAHSSRRLDLATVTDSSNRMLLDKYESADILVGVWDVTSDIGIPAFRTVIVDRNPDPSRKIGSVEGMGCHPCKEIALSRALTEAAQGRVTMISGARDDNDYNSYASFAGNHLVNTAAWAHSETPRSFADIPSYYNENEETDLALIESKLQLAGMPRIYTFDLTRFDDIHVVRVVVPYLETYHHVKDYVPGERCKKVMSS